MSQPQDMKDLGARIYAAELNIDGLKKHYLSHLLIGDVPNADRARACMHDQLDIILDLYSQMALLSKT